MQTIQAMSLALMLALPAGTAALAQQEQPAGAQSVYGQQMVAYHINEPGGEEGRAYLGALRNAQNHIDAVGPDNIDLVVVMHGDGLGLLQDAMTNDRLQSAIAGLKGQGVRFEVCNNTLVGRDIDWKTDLYDVWEDDIVPSGVAQLSYLQQQGYTYLKP